MRYALIALLLAACAGAPPDVGPCAPAVYEARLAAKFAECAPLVDACFIDEPCPALDECLAFARHARDECLR